ncbi:MAG: ATP-binding protein [Actinomycetota bacterium]|nr:ATP-binding protein [Actinomycetota bacterium]
MERTKITTLLERTRGLAVFRDVPKMPGVRDLLALLAILTKDEPEPGVFAEGYARLWRSLAETPERLLPDAWRSCLARAILDDENPFSLGCERGTPDPLFAEQARRELEALRGLFGLDSKTLLGLVEGAAPSLAGTWTAPVHETFPDASPRAAMAGELAGDGDSAETVEGLAEHFARHGAGALGRHAAFRWRGGRLAPVTRPDGIRLDGLVGYEGERGPLVENTRRFLAGLPAHHALLYGPPGTGKSSTVKAVANEYAGKGLKLVEVSKEDLGELPALLDVLRGRGPRFVLFVDDLSFEEHEVEYKALKALLEGSIEEPPPNVRVYATSNRRNLIRENFSDRGEPGDDVHARDTMQEKLSLSARFGLRLTFPAPNQERFLGIISGLVRERGIKVPPGQLRERALLWDRWHAGRSGRTARQFVDELEAGLAYDPADESPRSLPR